MEGTRVGAPNQCSDVLHFKVHIVGALLMYGGDPKVKQCARKVRHATRGVHTCARPVLASFGKILPENPVF